MSAPSMYGPTPAHSIAHSAALEWMARTGMAVDPRFTYGQLTAYAGELADMLVRNAGTRDEWVNGMRLIRGAHFDYVETR